MLTLLQIQVSLLQILYKSLLHVLHVLYIKRRCRRIILIQSKNFTWHYKNCFIAFYHFVLESRTVTGQIQTMDTEYDVYETIKDELDCPICKEMFSSPKSLSCGHIFCHDCLQKAVKTYQYTDTLNCPTCRRPTSLSINGVDGLANNYHISNLIEKIKQQRINIPLKPATRASNTTVCEEHDKTMDLFCEDCDTGICTTCMLKTHKSHKFTGMEEKIAELRTAFEAIIPVSHKVLEKSSIAANKMKEEKQILTNQKDKVLSSINSYFSVLHETITNRETLLCESVGKYYQLKLTDVDDALLPVDMQSHILSKQISQVRSVTDATTAYLINIKSLTTTVQEENAKILQLVEEAERVNFSEYFLTFMSNATMQSQLSEEGGLNECVALKESGRNAVAAFKVKRKLLIRRGTIPRLHFESNSSEPEEEDCDQYEKPPDNLDQKIPPDLDQETNPEPLYDDVYVDTKEQQRLSLSVPPPVPLRPHSPSLNEMQDLSGYGQFSFPYANFMSDLHTQILKPVNQFRLNHAAGNLKNAIQPWGLAVSPNSEIYITDIGNHCVLVITSDGRLSRVIGTRGAGRGQFLMPVDVALDEKCNVYVADRQNGSVQKFTPNGRIKSRFRQGDDLKEPNGLAVFRNKIYVSDRLGNKIVVFDQQGSLISIISPLTAVGSNPFQPAGITIHPKYEKIYVADRCNHQVLIFNNDGDLVSCIGQKGHGQGQLLFPNGVAITPNDLLLVTETETHRISVFNSKSGKFVKSFGKSGEEEGMFITPRHLATNRHGEVYVADEQNQRIQVFNVAEDPAYIEIQEIMYNK